MKKDVYCDGLGALIALAEEHGWVDTFGDASTGWSDRDSDAAEEAAEKYLRDNGINPVYEEPEDETNALYEKVMQNADEMMHCADIEPTSAIKQAASDLGIEYGDEMGKCVNYIWNKWFGQDHYSSK